MKITDVRAIYPNWKQLPQGVWQSAFWQIVVCVESDTGLRGYGYGGGEPGAMVVNRHFKHVINGRKIDTVEHIRDLWEAMYQASLPYGRKGIPVMALSGVDLALWDLLAKAMAVPVYELVGGLKRESVEAYATSSALERCRDLGYRSIKPVLGRRADPEKTERLIAKARQLFGPDAKVMADSYMAWDRQRTLEMAQRLGPYGVYWFEDVLTPDLLDGQAELRSKIKPIKLAGGEHEFTQFGFEAIAKAGALDIWQPDIAWCGGMTAALQILKLADRVGASVVMHRGGEIWGLHFIVATHCEPFAETHPHRWEPGAEVLWLDEPQANAGMISPPDRPGFGVSLNESMLS